MSTETPISYKEFISWIMEQPDDRPLNMRESQITMDKHRRKNCTGCLMAQWYMDNVFKKKEGQVGDKFDYVSCSSTRIQARYEMLGYETYRLERQINDILPIHKWNDTRKFGDAKKFIQED